VENLERFIAEYNDPLTRFDQQTYNSRRIMLIDKDTATLWGEYVEDMM
jgi:hypothetical protein